VTVNRGGGREPGDFRKLSLIGGTPRWRFTNDCVYGYRVSAKASTATNAEGGGESATYRLWKEGQGGAAEKVTKSYTQWAGVRKERGRKQ